MDWNERKGKSMGEGAVSKMLANHMTCIQSPLKTEAWGSCICNPSPRRERRGRSLELSDNATWSIWKYPGQGKALLQKPSGQNLRTVTQKSTLGRESGWEGQWGWQETNEERIVIVKTKVGTENPYDKFPDQISETTKWKWRLKITFYDNLERYPRNSKIAKLHAKATF